MYNNHMEKEQKNTLITFLYLLLFYLACKFLPFEKIPGPNFVAPLLQALVLLGILIFVLLEEKKCQIPRKEGTQNPFLSFPLFLICFSNLLYLLCFQIAPSKTVDVPLFLSETLVTFFSITIEELLFRSLLFPFFQSLIQGKHSDELSILVSSACFSLMHAINFIGNAPLSVVMQMGYTLFLGVVLASITLYHKRGIYLAISFHFFFNFINSDLINALFSYQINLNYVLFNLTFGVLALLYLFFLYHRHQKGNENVTGHRN